MCSLINIGNGDTAYFRYIEVDKATQNIEVSAEGSGTVSVYWGEKQVSRISIQDGVSGKAVAHGETGIHEMKLVFSDTKQLKIHSIVVK